MCPTISFKPLRVGLLLAALLGAGTAQAASDAPFLWQVQGTKTTHYLLGSMHLLPKSAQLLPPGIVQAYDSADRLVFESDIDALSTPDNNRAMLASARAPNGLKGEVDAVTYTKVLTRLRAMGTSAQICEPYRPWFCAMSLELVSYARAGFRGEYGLDRQLRDAAVKAGKPMTWFEPPARHLALFTGMPPKLSQQFLAAALSEQQQKLEEPAQMFRAWRDNDTASVERLVADVKRDYPEVHDYLLASRNRAWLPELKRLLAEPKRQLIVVGAAHWLGPDGLIASLTKAGYTVRPYLLSDPDQVAQRAESAIASR